MNFQKHFAAFKSLNMILLSCFFICFISTAQEIHDEKLDSLYQLTLQQMQSDKYYQSLKTINQIKELAAEKKLENYRADADNLLGLAFVQHYAYKKAEDHFHKAITSNKKRKDTVSLAINYANLLHLYVLAKNYDKYDAYIAEATSIDAKANNRNRFYYYESEMIRLYDLTKYDSLIYVSKKALNDLKNGPYFSVYTDKKQRDLVKHRLEATFELFLAYGLMEQNLEKENAYKLLNKLEKIKLDEVLWYSPRVFEHISRVRSYKELYHIQQEPIDKDSILYYKKATAFYTAKANTILKEKSAENNQYVINSINREEELKRMQIISENQANENALIRKINYLSIFFFMIAFSFLVYYYISSKKLRKANSDLKKLQADRNKFLAVVSHEIRTPLYALGELVTKLVNERKEQNKEEIAHINNSIINLRHAIDNSLQFSRFNYFGIDIRFYNRIVHLSAFSKDILQYFNLIAQLHNCEIAIQSNLQNHYFILDETKIAIVLRNILKNAIEAPNVSKIIFKINEHIISDETSEIRFSIQDNGQGIPKKTLDDIQHKRILLPSENEHKGIRLGLILCNQILSLYDTELSFNKQGNHHYEVSFTLPLKRETNVSEATLTEEYQKNKHNRILVVDDNKINLLITKKIFENMSLECDIVNNGHEAIQKVKTQDYDLVIMDLNMPDMDGFETTEVIKNIKPTIPIVAYTALSLDEVATKCKEIGMYDVITKPMQKRELKQILNRLSIMESN